MAGSAAFPALGLLPLRGGWSYSGLRFNQPQRKAYAVLKFRRHSDLLRLRELLVIGDYFSLIPERQGTVGVNLIHLIAHMPDGLDLWPIPLNHSTRRSRISVVPPNKFDCFVLYDSRGSPREPGLRSIWYSKA